MTLRLDVIIKGAITVFKFKLCLNNLPTDVKLLFRFNCVHIKVALPGDATKMRLKSVTTNRLL